MTEIGSIVVLLFAIVVSLFASLFITIFSFLILGIDYEWKLHYVSIMTIIVFFILFYFSYLK